MGSLVASIPPAGGIVEIPKEREAWSSVFFSFAGRGVPRPYRVTGLKVAEDFLGGAGAAPKYCCPLGTRTLSGPSCGRAQGFAPNSGI